MYPKVIQSFDDTLCNTADHVLLKEESTISEYGVPEVLAVVSGYTT